jgi:ABC-type multidrug transport system ATPase subunit
MSSILEIDSVTHAYDNHQVLNGIYLKCQTGEIIGLLGRNGTGKSTLLKIIFGTLEAESKFIRIDGTVYEYPYKTKDLLCYLPQDDFLPKNITVEQAVKLYYGKESAKVFFDDELLSKIKKSRIWHLSGGEIRYLETKLLVSTDSKFLLLDEPFNGVSPLVIEHVKTLITKASKTKGIILTDHDYRNVLDLANQYWLMAEGRIIQVKDRNALIELGYLP